MQALLTAQTAGVASETASDAGDSVVDLEEDEAWGKVEKGKRRAVLRWEHDALAARLSKGLSKVSTITSPFKKGES